MSLDWDNISEVASNEYDATSFLSAIARCILWASLGIVNQRSLWLASGQIPEGEDWDEIQAALSVAATELATEVSGMALTPKHQSIFVRDMNILGDKDLTMHVSTVMEHCSWGNITPAVNGDEFFWHWIAPAEAFTVHVLGVMIASAGITALYVDDELVPDSSFDWWSPSVVANVDVSRQVSGLEVGTEYRFALRVVDKNPPSSGYAIPVTRAWLKI
jgi:hypothetical protein